MPRPKRTSAEVAEAKAKKAELLQRLEELDREKKMALAQMEVDEEEQDIEEEETAVRHLKDLQDIESNEDLPFAKDDDGPETFPMDEDEPLTFPNSDEDESGDDISKSESVQSKPKPVSVLRVLKLSFALIKRIQKKKPARGETREAIEAEKSNLRQEWQNLKRPAEDNTDKS
jgi:hypothetical protein